MSGVFVVSLDFELHWGIHDSIPQERYQANLLGVRRAVPALLALFREFDVHATWATVGMLFCGSRAELQANLPTRKPSYGDPTLSPYLRLADQVGENEAEDPIHFAPSLIREIAATAGQEVGTHTFSHYLCLEDGGDPDAFRDDLRAAARMADKFQLELRSLVFPRNQFRREYLAVCRELGIRAYRGNPPSALYRERAGAKESWARRGARLIDAYLPLSGDNSYRLDDRGEPYNVPASRFLRPYDPRLTALEPLRRRRILGDLERAAHGGRVYHLWWHPHNFGRHLDENLTFLRPILRKVAELRTRGDLRCLNMGELAAERAGAESAA